MKKKIELADRINIMESTDCEPDTTITGIKRCHKDNACDQQKIINHLLGELSTVRSNGRPISVCPQHYLTKNGFYANETYSPGS